MEEPSYNFRHFQFHGNEFKDAPGPRCGQAAVDFPLHHLDGSRGRLSDFFGRPLVLETGSCTCPVYVGNIEGSNRLVRRYPELCWLVLYVREAHPGERQPAHQSLEEKLRLARTLEPRDGEGRQVVVDGLDGEGHRAYGALPNMVYLIDAEGVVRFRGLWMNHEALERAIRRLSQGRSLASEVYGPSLPSMTTAFEVLRRGGLQAMWDMFRSLPGLGLARWDLYRRKAREGREEAAAREAPGTGSEDLA